METNKTAQSEHIQKREPGSVDPNPHTYPAASNSKSIPDEPQGYANGNAEENKIKYEGPDRTEDHDHKVPKGKKS